MAAKPRRVPAPDKNRTVFTTARCTGLDVTSRAVSCSVSYTIQHVRARGTGPRKQLSLPFCTRRSTRVVFLHRLSKKGGSWWNDAREKMGNGM